MKGGLKNYNEIANFVKRKMWDNNVRATTRGMKPGWVLMAGNIHVFCTDDPTMQKMGGADYSALVTDYGMVKTVRFFNKRGKLEKALLYHLGRC